MVFSGGAHTSRFEQNFLIPVNIRTCPFTHNLWECESRIHFSIAPVQFYYSIKVLKGKEKRNSVNPKQKNSTLFSNEEEESESDLTHSPRLGTQWVALVNKKHNISPYPCPNLTQHYSLNRNHNIYYLDNKQYFSLTQECWNDFTAEYCAELCSLWIWEGESEWWLTRRRNGMRWHAGHGMYTEIFSRMSNGNSILFIGHKRKFILDFITEREYITRSEAMPMS